MYELLKSFNPWWVTAKVPQALLGTQRPHYLGQIKNVLSHREIIELIGIRRSGKTTLLYQTIDFLLKSNVPPLNILFVPIDSESLQLQLNKNNPLDAILSEYISRIVPRGKIYILFDEIQSIDRFGGFIKEIYESKPDFKFILSGSNSNLLQDESTRKLVGRTYTIPVHPLSFKEILEFTDTPYQKETERVVSSIKYWLNRYFTYGGFPEIVRAFLNPPFSLKDGAVVLPSMEINGELTFCRHLLQEYFEGILYKDIIQVYSIREANLLSRLATYIAVNSGGKTNSTSLCNILGSNKNTIDDYLRYLVKSYLIVDIPFYSQSRKSTIRKDRKYYVRDNGFYTIFSSRVDEGFVAETTVLLKLLEQFSTDSIFYWDGNHECDFIVDKFGTKMAIEVKYQNQDREVKGLIEAMEKLKLSEGIVVTKDIEREEKFKEKKIKYIPLWKFLLDF